MDPTLVLAKTDKGREEIEKRTWRLESRRRMLLIMVDGQHTAEDIAAKSVSAEDAFAALQTLWAEGFIAPADGSAPAAPEPEVAAPKTTKSLQELQRAASRAISNLLGPDGETMALRLEKTASVEQFMVEAQRTREALRGYAGQKKADAFWAALGL